MVTKFWRSERGATLVEGLIVFPIIFLTITSFVEMGVAVYQYNQTAKAVAVGARLAAVSTPLVALTSLEATGTAGAPVPDVAAEVSCVGSGCTGLDRIVYGTQRSCNASAETGVLGMCDINPAIRLENVRVTYMRSALGYIGRPRNPVVSIKVELQNVRFRFFLLGAIIGLNNLPIPAQSVTVTSEDLSSTPI